MQTQTKIDHFPSLMKDPFLTLTIVGVVRCVYYAAVNLTPQRENGAQGFCHPLKEEAAASSSCAKNGYHVYKESNSAHLQKKGSKNLCSTWPQNFS